MKEKINLTKDNGETIEVDLVSYFKLKNNGKQYMFYTLNEVVEAGYVKLYISEVTSEGLSFRLQKVMNEEDWTNIKGIMRKILTNQINDEVIYLEVGEI